MLLISHNNKERKKKTESILFKTAFDKAAARDINND
jgi:hypothetical protein